MSDHAFPTRPLPLRINFLWTLAGNVVYAGCQWGMLVILARLGSPAMVGQFALGLAVTAPIIILTNLQLRAVQATDTSHLYLFGDYLALRLAGTVLALLVMVGAVLVSGYRWETTLVVLGIGLAKAFESVSDVIYGLLQQHERMDRIATSMMIKGPLSLIALAVTVHLTGSVLFGSVALAASWALLLAVYDLPSGAWLLRATSAFGNGDGAKTAAATPPTEAPRTLRPRWHMPTLGRLAWLSFPLGLVVTLISLNSNVPRYFVEHYLGERELGIFAALASLMMVGNTVVLALGQSASPRLARHFADRDLSAYRRLLSKLVLIGGLLGGAGLVAALVFGRQILTLFFGAEYAEHQTVFVWLMGACALGYEASFLGFSMTAARYFRVQIPLFATVAIASAVLCWWMVPAHGMLGAAWAVLLSTAIQLGGSAAVTAYVLHTLKRKSPREVV